MKMQYLLAGLLALTACKETDTHTRIVFDPGDEQMITSRVNKRQETMSVLYGNPSAFNAALKGDTLPGANYTLVTWKYHDNPLFYGSTINGELLRVERLEVGTTAIDYQVEQGTPQARDERVKYILSMQPSMMP
ncbi:cytochrome P460 family protein [Chitinophaga horti]|uniref:Cytochrome P460 family protein n=1 Tax=Chitinophaga horti TaxID=2920382 RepID=A0ABY6IWV1_9BACT|nr:cytochrome P460 family protein [Chitinophaga horti]UYQ91723.1 cytochrome P460 family protein [Chitinophaga horti]